MGNLSRKTADIQLQHGYTLLHTLTPWFQIRYMKSLVRRLTTLTALTAATLCGSLTFSPTAVASPFGQQPIPSDRVVAVAEPVNNGQLYNLLIIEQISSVRRCWAEQGSGPTRINPLLLTFDFSGLCGRSSDSNGYSVRLAGEDTRYRLQVVRRGNDLVLVAAPSPLQRNLPTLEIGRTNGIANDFIKIDLHPGWQMARRVYNGQTLGHIYLSNEQSLDAVVAAAGGSSQPTPPPSSSPPALPGSRPSLPAPGASGSPTAATGDFRVIVPGNSAILQRRVQSIESGAFRATVNGQTVIQAGRFRERARAEELRARLSQANLNAQIVEGQGTFNPPPSSGTPSAQRTYQVIVPGSSNLIRARVNRIESGAFRTTVNGRTVIQAGLFREAARAEELRRRLSQAGLPVQVIEGTGAIATPSPSPSPSIPRPTNGRPLVLLDPGHGGRDPGAIGRGGLQEKEVNITISRRIQERLEAQGIQVVMTRTGDSAVSLQGRVDIAERANATIFVSIHANAISLSRPEVNGLETYYYGSSAGRDLANTIHSRVLRETDLRDRRVRSARFYVLRNTSMPAVLVETGFLTGAEDAARLQNLSTRLQIADAIAQGILDYLR